MNNAAIRGELSRAADRLRWLLDRWEDLDPDAKRALQARTEEAKEKKEFRAKMKKAGGETGVGDEDEDGDDDDDPKRGKLSTDQAWRLALEEMVQRVRAAAGAEVGDRYRRLGREMEAIETCFKLAAAAAAAWAEQVLGPGAAVIGSALGGWRVGGPAERRSRRVLERSRLRIGWGGRRARGCVRPAAACEEAGRGKEGRRRLWRRWVSLLVLGGMRE